MVTILPPPDTENSGKLHERHEVDAGGSSLKSEGRDFVGVGVWEKSPSLLGVDCVRVGVARPPWPLGGVPKLPRGRGILEAGGVLQGDSEEELFVENSAGIWGELGRFGVSEGLTIIAGAGLALMSSFDDSPSERVESRVEPRVEDGESGGGESEVDVE